MLALTVAAGAAERRQLVPELPEPAEHSKLELQQQPQEHSGPEAEMEVAAGQTLVAGQVEPQQPQHSVEPRVDGLLLRKLQAGGQQRRLGVPRHPKPEAWRPLVLRAAWPRSLGQAEEAPQQFLVLAEAAEQFAGERAAAR